MKIGQLLSTIPDLLHSEYVNALSQLQSNILLQMGWNFVRKRMKSELGLNGKKFKIRKRTLRSCFTWTMHKT